MTTENLLPHRQTGPQKLYARHQATLALDNPLVIDTEQALFAHMDERDVKSALIYLPKSKCLIDMTLALVSGMVARGGTVVLTGGNDAGIRSADELYEKNIGPVEQKIVGNHSAMYVGKNQGISATKKLHDFLSCSTLSYMEESIEVASLPGVFSTGKLDAGTKLLLDTIPYTAKNVLDIGCGAGVIGTIYKKKSPESDVTMSDVSPLAVEATKKTVEKNKIETKVLLSDVFSKVSGEYDLMLVNPPFHKGVGTDYSFIEIFARDARKHLVRGGAIYLVCNSFLAYEKKLELAGWSVSVAIDNNSFKVLLVK
jgi:16S rRNA (guanine1207-N2)-methyltransferase